MSGHMIGNIFEICYLAQKLAIFIFVLALKMSGI